MKTQNHPQSYTPLCPADFIGGAHTVAKILTGKSSACKLSGAPVKVVRAARKRKMKLSEWMTGACDNASSE